MNFFIFHFLVQFKQWSAAIIYTHRNQHITDINEIYHKSQFTTNSSLYEAPQFAHQNEQYLDDSN